MDRLKKAKNENCVVEISTAELIYGDIVVLDVDKDLELVTVRHFKIPGQSFTISTKEIKDVKYQSLK